MKRLVRNKRFVFLIITFLIIASGSYFAFIKEDKAQGSSNPKSIATSPEKKVDLNREFEFDIQVINDQGNFLTTKEKIKFILTDAELKDEIKLKGEPKKANDGQQYLILRIELQNNSSSRLAIISNKYIRLTDPDGKKYSPDFHNAMIAIDPLSVRRDLVAYIVNTSTKTFNFQVGELDGDKQSIEIAF